MFDAEIKKIDQELRKLGNLQPNFKNFTFTKSDKVREMNMRFQRYKLLT